jgi:hypothetical protein
MKMITDGDLWTLRGFPPFSKRQCGRFIDCCNDKWASCTRSQGKDHVELICLLLLNVNIFTIMCGYLCLPTRFSNNKGRRFPNCVQLYIVWCNADNFSSDGFHKKVILH